MTVGRIMDDREIETAAMANCLMLLSNIDKAEESSGRMYECKTCNRMFNSFQALGGHRASHNKPKLSLDGFHSTPKPKTHECSICGAKFAIGQALGGHMRRHRSFTNIPLSVKTLPVFKRCNSSKRVCCLDLNLTPYENHLYTEEGVPTLKWFL